MATAGGAPGALIKIAVIEPPNVPAQYRAANIAIAGIGSSCNVNGVKSAIAIGELNPGSAPTSTPIRTPSEIRMIFSSLSKSEKPSIIASIRLEPF